MAHTRSLLLSCDCLLCQAMPHVRAARDQLSTVHAISGGGGQRLRAACARVADRRCNRGLTKSFCVNVLHCDSEGYSGWATPYYNDSHRRFRTALREVHTTQLQQCTAAMRTQLLSARRTISIHSLSSNARGTVLACAFSSSTRRSRRSATSGTRSVGCALLSRCRGR